MPDRITASNQIVFVQEHERRLNRMDEQFEHLRERTEEYATKTDFGTLSEKVDKMNERLLIFSFSFAGASAVFAFTVMAATGRLP